MGWQQNSNLSGISADVYRRQADDGYRSLRFQRRLEKLFLQKHNSENIDRVRVALNVGALVLTVDAIMDCLVYFSGWQAVLQETFILLCIGPALMLTGYMVSRHGESIRTARYTLGVVVLASFGLMFARAFLAEDPEMVRLEAYIVLAVFNFFLFGLPFYYALVGATCIFLGYVWSEMLLGVPPMGYINDSFYLLCVILAGITGSYVTEYAMRRDFLESRYLGSLSERDELTRLYNRRAFNQNFDRVLRLAEREKANVVILLFDVDYFKRFNDCYGHLQGDECLKRVAESLQENARRPLDMAARFGGEEFILLLYDPDPNAVKMIAERCIHAVRELAVPHKDSPHGVVSVSCGVALLSGATLENALLILETADRALYEAKEAGRNTVSVIVDEVSPELRATV